MQNHPITKVSNDNSANANIYARKENHKFQDLF